MRVVVGGGQIDSLATLRARVFFCGRKECRANPVGGRAATQGDHFTLPSTFNHIERQEPGKHAVDFSHKPGQLIGLMQPTQGPDAVGMPVGVQFGAHFSLVAWFDGSDDHGHGGEGSHSDRRHRACNKPQLHRLRIFSP